MSRINAGNFNAAQSALFQRAADRVVVRLKGFDEFGDVMADLTARMVDAAARKAVRAAAKPIVAQARANLAALPLRDSTGLLRRSVGLKVKKYTNRYVDLRGFVRSGKAARTAARAGTTVAIIGPRHGFAQMVAREYGYGVSRGVATRLSDRKQVRSRWSDPAKYGHLIESGARPHHIGRGSRLRDDGRRARSDRRVRGNITRGSIHPGFPGRPWLKAAMISRRAEAERIMAASFAESLRQEAARARAKIAAARPRRAA